jgi:KUP system potassium uptake protein
LRILHTSEHEVGQIYVPWVNWALMVSVVALVLAFRSSAHLAFAYGMAVTGTFTITTVLFFYIVRHRWGRPRWLVIAGASGFLAFDLSFLAANLTKFTHGGWVPLLIGVVVFTVMITWQRGRELVTEERKRAEGPLGDFVVALREKSPPIARVPGVAVFLNRGRETTPLAMRATVEHNHSLHEHVVVLSIDTQPVPRVPEAERVVLDDLGFSDDGISFVSARFGYMEEPDVPAVLQVAVSAGLECPLEESEISYFLSLLEMRRTDGPGMSAWRKRLFLVTADIAADAGDYFKLPRDRTVVMGSQIEF